MKLLNKSFSYWLRVIHRDLGFLMVGLCLVYGVSGFLLNHMNGKDPAFKTTESRVELKKGMDKDEIIAEWISDSGLPRLKKVFRIDDEHFRIMLDGGVGIYNSHTGITEYETHEKRPVIYWLNRLHYNRVNGWNVMGDFFAFSLVFFAISGLFMIKGKNGIVGRGKWYLLVGILIPILYVFLS
ncbi:PepSY-associated TM helix domain-containing protein [Bacteroides caecigallinarum]|uniref:PepSY-associated TM helix domain-containing protein n=1 Tax=Bacteroides caecigallinarum TaxID=1411144 RepID=UPI00195AA0E0|nr:PepSY-associated TM helix domain-containing protein [Bacteroides caecigallinarum]MBM6865487.1 PepSY-associated TM helix domain-containing protein [Bacteroides caecigallinarum]